MQVVLSVTVMLVDLYVAMFCSTYVGANFCGKYVCDNFHCNYAGRGVSIAIMQVVFSVVLYAHYCFFCNYAGDCFCSSYIGDSFK